MTQSLVVIRNRTHELDSSATLNYFQASKEAVSRLPGFEGGAMWVQVDDPDSKFVVFAYEDVHAANAGLELLTKVKPLIDSQVVGRNPSDVLRVFVRSSEGALRGHYESATYISSSVRVAEPGYGVEMVEELDRVFAELRFIPGYLGSLIGVNESLPEEVLGLVAWSSPEAFAASLPRSVPYSVKLFKVQTF